jgi:hypothetical protein
MTKRYANIFELDSVRSGWVNDMTYNTFIPGEICRVKLSTELNTYLFIRAVGEDS